MSAFEADRFNQLTHLSAEEAAGPVFQFSKLLPVRATTSANLDTAKMSNDERQDEE
jgi:hypothetical protein